VGTVSSTRIEKLPRINTVSALSWVCLGVTSLRERIFWTRGLGEGTAGSMIITAEPLTLTDDIGATTGNERDNTLYHVKLDDSREMDFRWRDLRPPNN
jgi:hypothetical protein